MVKVTGNGNVNIVYRAYILQNSIDLRQTETTVIDTRQLIQHNRQIRFTIQRKWFVSSRPY